jgi:hypothetical protein
MAEAVEVWLVGSSLLEVRHIAEASVLLLLVESGKACLDSMDPVAVVVDRLAVGEKAETEVAQLVR